MHFDVVFRSPMSASGPRLLKRSLRHQLSDKWMVVPVSLASLYIHSLTAAISCPALYVRSVSFEKEGCGAQMAAFKVPHHSESQSELFRNTQTGS